MGILLFVVALAFILIIYYNKLVRRKNEVGNATGSINAMLKNRYDLIPNLVDTVKSYMSYERDVLDKLTAMRTKAIADNIAEEERIALNNKISGALGQIMVAMENYPELKASNNFLQLQEGWTDLEERISASRRFYNNAVTDYNNAITSFPGNILATIMGYKTKSIFEVTQEEALSPKAKNLFSN